MSRMASKDGITTTSTITTNEWIGEQQWAEKKRNREIGRVSKKQGKKTYKVKIEIEKEQNQFN